MILGQLKDYILDFLGSTISFKLSNGPSVGRYGPWSNVELEQKQCIDVSISTDRTFFFCFSPQDPFGTLDLSMLKVLDMMIGELEYSTFFVDKTLYLPDLTRFIFVVFCALIPIVFMNLLVSRTLYHFINYNSL